MSKAKKAKKVYKLRFFWVLVCFGIYLLLLGILNIAINVESIQRQFTDYVYTKTNTILIYKKLNFNLFTGDIEGDDIAIKAEKTNLDLSLQKFKFSYNPLYMWIGRFKITKIQAEQIWIDSSNLIKREKNTKKIEVPKFLQRIKLDEAKVKTFYWKQAEDKSLAIDDINISSRFGSNFSRSPLSLKVKKLAYKSPKIDSFIENIELDGFFLLDFSKTFIFDETKVALKGAIHDTLLAFYKRPKPWLDDEPWDNDMDPIIHKHYNTIPGNRTFLFLNEVSFDLQKSQKQFYLKDLGVNLFGSEFEGWGQHNLQNKNLQVYFKTKSPMPLSKLPLGQAKIRHSFEDFSLNTAIKGKFENLKKHSLKIDLKTELLKNLVNPDVENLVLNLKANLTNQVIKASDIQASLGAGTLKGQAELNLKNKTVQSSFDLKQIDTHTVVRFFSNVNVPAYADAKVQINGALKNPTFNIDLTTEQVGYEFLNLGPATGKLTIKNKQFNLAVKTQASSHANSDLTLKISNVFDPFQQTIELRSTHKNVEIQKLFKADVLSGTLNGRFDLDRSKNATIKAVADITATNFAAWNNVFGDLSAKANILNKRAKILPISLKMKETGKVFTSSKGLEFNFDDEGFVLKGDLPNQVALKANYKKLSPGKVIHFEFFPDKMSLEMFAPLLPFSPTESSLSGKVDLHYNTEDPLQSRMSSQIKKANITTTEGQFELLNPTTFKYEQKAFQFNRFKLKEGLGQLELNGSLGLETGNSNLKVKGLVDFRPLVDFNPFISDSETPISIDLTIKGELLKPDLYGTVDLKNSSIQFRKVPADLTEINGLLTFNGKRITTKNLNLNYDDAPVTVNGWVTTNYERILSANLSLKGNEVPLHPVEGLDLYSDIDFQITGQNSLSLRGSMNILEGQYNQPVTLTNFIIKPVSTLEDEEQDTLAGLPLNTRLQLQISNTGDLQIKNNLAELEINADLEMFGTIEKPDLVGQLDFLNGKINAFGVAFENASGYAQFRRNRGLVPEMNLIARKEIQNYSILARIEGDANNLRLNLDSQPALDRREILSIIFYGQTPDLLTTDRRRNFTQTAAISQIATILSDPLNRLSGLDVFEVSSRRETSASDSIQRLSVGKTLSDRFDVAFTTDIGIDDPERAFELRYQLFDNFYFIMAKDVVVDNRYRFDINYRLETY